MIGRQCSITMSKGSSSVKGYAWVKLNRRDLDSCMEWYRASHHGFRCGKPVGSCHAAKKKLLISLKEIMGSR